MHKFPIVEGTIPQMLIESKLFVNMVVYGSTEERKGAHTAVGPPLGSATDREAAMAVPENTNQPLPPNPQSLRFDLQLFKIAYASPLRWKKKRGQRSAFCEQKKRSEAHMMERKLNWRLGSSGNGPALCCSSFVAAVTSAFV